MTSDWGLGLGGLTTKWNSPGWKFRIEKVLSFWIHFIPKSVSKWNSFILIYNSKSNQKFLSESDSIRPNRRSSKNSNPNESDLIRMHVNYFFFFNRNFICKWIVTMKGDFELGPWNEKAFWIHLNWGFGLKRIEIWVPNWFRSHLDWEHWLNRIESRSN